MGEPDKCIFCEDNVEEWDYEYYINKKNRAGDMNLCKDCLKKTLKKYSK